MCRRVTVTVALLLQLLGAALAAQPRKPAQKVPQLRKALQEYREKNDLRGEANTLLSLGIAESRLNNADAAKSNLTEAAGKMSAQNDVVGAWLAFFTLSELEEAAGRPAEAIVSVEKALAIINDAKVSTGPFSFETLFTLWNTPQSVAGFYESYGGWMKPMILEDLLEPITRDSYGSLLMDLGQLERAETELNKAADCVKDALFKYNAIEAHLGDLRFLQKRYDEARTHYQNGLDLTTQTSMDPVADSMNELWFYERLAAVETSTSHPEEAKRWNEKRLELAGSANMGLQEPVTLPFISATGESSSPPRERLPDTAVALNDALNVVRAAKQAAEQAGTEFSLGRLQMLNGNYGSAAAHLERSVQLYASLNDPLSEMGAWESLCLVYLYTANYAAVENALGRAHQRVEMGKIQVVDDSFACMETALRYKKGQATTKDLEPCMERVRQRLSAVDSEVGQDYQQVAAHMIQALEEQDFSGLEGRSDVPILGAYRRLVDSIHEIQKGDLAGAREIWGDLLEENTNHEQRAIFLLLTGLSHLMQSGVEEASPWFTEGTRTLEEGIDDIQSEAMLTNYLGNLQLYFDNLLEIQVLFGKIAEGFETSERARARTFLRLLGNHRLKLPPNSSSLVKEAEDLRKRIAHWDQEPQPGVSESDLRQQYEALLSRVQIAAPEYSALTGVPAQQLDAVRNALPADTTLLSYFVTPFSVHVWVIDNETMEHVRLLVSDVQLRRISCWAFELARPRSARPADDNGCAAGPANAVEAYAALIEPVRTKILKKRLMIVPHGALHYVPFAALYDEKRKRYLVEDYPIAYIPSASTIRFLRDKDSPVDGGALVLGDPLTTSPSRLPGAAREARKVARKLHVTAKLGAAAQKSLLQGLNGKVDLIHIAAHGTYDPVSPLFSAIHLAEGNGENGQLNVDEIQSELDLSGVNLVVLSACQSGVGTRSGGDEIVGLTRSLLYAGSPGVIATLWNISDDATPPLIEKFYDRLLAGASAGDALRAAQVDMLRTPKFADPRYWAAFFLTGDPRGRWSGRRASSFR